jgi:hypothetical protein
MSRPPLASAVPCGVGTGVCEEGRHHRVQARCASAAQSRGASVGNRAAMNGGSMSRPPLASAVPCGVGTGGLRRGTTSSGSSAMRERHSIDGQE